MTEERCEKCRYYKPDEGTRYGTCHKGPPVVIADNYGGATSQWPNVMRDEWCGEFSSADNYYRRTGL